jgi:glycosyltransferase involved in cell wall biosynthesis
VKIAFVAANTFQYDARQLRAATALAADGHTISLIGLAGPGLPAHEQLDGGIELHRVAVDTTIASAFRPLPAAGRRAVARLLGIDPTATQLPPARSAGLDRLRAPFRRLAEVLAHARRVGPWTAAVLEAQPDADVYACKALIALPVVRGAAGRTGGRFVYDIADIHTEAARLARMPGWFRSLVRRRERRWMAEAAGLTAVSPDVADEVVRLFGVPRPVVVLNTPPAWRPGEDLPERTGRLRGRLGIAADRPLVLYQGGFSVDRGIEELVAALDDPAVAGKDVTVAFIGYGRLRAWLDEQAARRPGRLAVLDPIAPAELQEWTVDADVGFVGQPGRTLNQRLNLANKLFEYLQAAVPVIVAEGTAHCRLVRSLEVGLCVDVDRPATIAAAIARFLGATAEERDGARRHARAVALETYTWEVQGAALVELYRRLARDAADRTDPARPRRGPEPAVSASPAEAVRPRRIAIVTHSVVEEDPRIRREAEALVAAGWQVDVFALRGPGDPSLDPAIRLIPIGVERHQGAGLGTYLAEYASFLVRVGWALARSQPSRRYRVVQVAAPPDPLIAAALPLRLLGVPLILDLHEATPEFFKSRFPGAVNPLSDRLLHLAERWSIALAKVAISVNSARHERLLALGYPAAKLRVVTNGPSLARFRPEDHQVRPFLADGTLRLVYAGAVTPLYELDVVVRAVAELGGRRPDLPVVFDVYGRGDAETRLAALADQLGVTDRVVLHGRIPLEEVATALAAADVGVSPIQRNAFGEISMPTKALEYAIMRKPVVAADLPAARQHFDADMLSWYESGNPQSLADALLRLVDDPAARVDGIDRAAVRARELSWDAEASAYADLVAEVAGVAPLNRPS